VKEKKKKENKKKEKNKWRRGGGCRGRKQNMRGKGGI